MELVRDLPDDLSGVLAVNFGAASALAVESLSLLLLWDLAESRVDRNESRFGFDLKESRVESREEATESRVDLKELRAEEEAEPLSKSLNGVFWRGVDGGVSVDFCDNLSSLHLALLDMVGDAYVVLQGLSCLSGFSEKDFLFERGLFRPEPLRGLSNLDLIPKFSSVHFFAKPGLSSPEFLLLSDSGFLSGPGLSNLEPLRELLPLMGPGLSNLEFLRELSPPTEGVLLLTGLSNRSLILLKGLAPLRHAESRTGLFSLEEGAALELLVVDFGSTREPQTSRIRRTFSDWTCPKPVVLPVLA